MSLKNIKIALITSQLFLIGSAYGSITMSIEFGELTTSNSVTIPGGTLWALISANSSGNLPGGLLINGALSLDHDKQSIIDDFSGRTIATGESIGGGVVFAVGSSSNSVPGDIGSTVEFDISDFSGLGLAAGDQFGLYWFPGRTINSNLIPVDGDFEIGGFHRTTANVASGGNQGMNIPTDGIAVTFAYFDNNITNGASGIDQVNFQAIMIPEPSSLLMLSASVFFALFRRR